MAQQREAEVNIDNELPFLHDKIPVSSGLAGFQALMEQYPGFTICPYIADKDEGSWDNSTSRVYMNQVLPGFLYTPVNVPIDDASGLKQLLETVKNDRRVAAVNITQPHKSRPALRRMFLGDENSDLNIDSLIRNGEGELEAYDLNAPAFVGWFNDEVGSFADKTVVLVGVGGVGEPMAKAIAKEAPIRLILIDPTDKTLLAEQLNGQTSVRYHSSISAAATECLDPGLILINAAGKEGATDNSGVSDLLKQYQALGNIFVDIRPQLDIGVVEIAKDLGWQAFTGHGMNARNDYALLSGIAKYIGVSPMPFADFQRLVAAAS